MATFAVWGAGPSTSEIVRNGEYNARAVCAANEHGFDGREGVDDSEVWYVLVECDEADLDEQTRHDHATVGFCAVPDVDAEKASQAADALLLAERDRVAFEKALKEGRDF